MVTLSLNIPASSVMLPVSVTSISLSGLIVAPDNPGSKAILSSPVCAAAVIIASRSEPAPESPVWVTMIGCRSAIP